MSTLGESTAVMGLAEIPPADPESADEPRVAHIGPIDDPRVAREWALVLQSQSIAYAMFHAGGGWLLQIAAADCGRALDHIELYEDENVDWPPVVRRTAPRHAPSPVVPLFWLALVLFFFYATGPATSGSVWFRRGTADALLLASEPWRMVTALTLHGDALHVLGNFLSGSIFAGALARRLGPGGALLATVATGALGNAANALYYHAEGHRSIGASTAVFGVIGALAAVETVTVLSRKGGERRALRWLDLLGPVVGGLCLLGTLGSGRDSDLGAHGFGFAAGLVGVLPVAWLVARSGRPPSQPLQIGLGVLGAALCAGAWAAALAG